MQSTDNQESERLVIRRSGDEIPCQVRRSSRARRYTLRIHPDLSVEVVVPVSADRKDVQAFVQSKAGWVGSRILLVQNPETKHEPGNVEYNGIRIPYQVRRNPRARRLTIKVNQEREVSIVAPVRTPLSRIHEFAWLHAEWIYRHTEGSSRPLPPVRTYTTSEAWPLFGETVRVTIQPGDHIGTELVDRRLVITIPPGLDGEERRDQAREALSDFFATSLYRFSLPHAKRYAEKIGVEVPVLKIRNQKTKWGSCTPRSVVLNLRLCMAPPGIVEYVIAHEICHKRHPNHSPAFWSTLEVMMPDYRSRRDYLRNKGYEWVL